MTCAVAGREPRRRLAARGVDALFMTPQLHVGLTPAHMGQLEAWAAAEAR